MKKKKDNKFASTTTQEPETNDLWSNEDQNQSNVAFPVKNKNGSPTHEKAPSLTQQYPPILQWPYTPQHAVEVERSPMISKPCVPTQSALPVLNGWQQSLLLQPTSTGHQVQQVQPPPHLAQPTAPFWTPQRPGYHFAGASVPASFQPFTPLGTTDASLQASAVIVGETSSRNQAQVPNFFYHVGCSYPGFPGPWDPTWRGQAQQSQPPCTYNFPGSYGYFSSPPLPMPHCSISFGQPFHRGIIKPPAKLSQKHQQLWEAQLQSEIADYKSRLMKLEAHICSLKPTVEEAATQVTGTVLVEQKSKRRTKRPVASLDMFPSPDESHPRAQGRKPAPCKVQPESIALKFEKRSLKKVENKEKAFHSTATTQPDNGEKVPNIVTNISDNMEINGHNVVMPLFHNQVHQEIPRGQVCSIGLNSLSEMKINDDKAENSKPAFSILSWQAKGINTKGASATSIGDTRNGTLRWPSNITSEGYGRSVLNMSSQDFYDNSNVIRQERKVIPEWSFVNEEDASEELEDAVVGSAKDENEEEMGDDASSGAEGTKDEGAYDMDGPGGTSTKVLSQCNNW